MHPTGISDGADTGLLIVNGIDPATGKYLVRLRKATAVGRRPASGLRRTGRWFRRRQPDPSSSRSPPIWVGVASAHFAEHKLAEQDL